MQRSTKARAAAAVGAVVVFAALIGVAAAMNFAPWGTPVNAESVAGTSSELNTVFNDGCPIQSPDGLSLYMASNRPGGLGGNDIWVAQRESRDARWGTPVNLGAPVNSSANDFCPTPLPGKRLLFVSERGGPDTCGGAAIYITRRNPAHGWDERMALGARQRRPNGSREPSQQCSRRGRPLVLLNTVGCAALLLESERQRQLQQRK